MCKCSCAKQTAIKSIYLYFSKLTEAYARGSPPYIVGIDSVCPRNVYTKNSVLEFIVAARC